MKVLVTGAAGGVQGATGHILTGILLKHGVHVRAFVRKDDDRAAALRASGAEVFIGDLLEIEDVRRAAKGMDYIYFTFAVQNGLMEATTIAAIAAKEAGVKGIINNSQWCADDVSRSPHARRHAYAEAILNAFPTPAVHLRGATYTKNIIAQLGAAATQAGVLRVPGMAASDIVPLIHGSDVAAVAGAVLHDFDKYANKAILLLAQLISLADIAKDFEKALGKKVTFETISLEDWKQTVRDHFPIDDTIFEHLGALWEIMREGSHNAELMAELRAAQPTLAKILGHKPLTLEDDIMSVYKPRTSSRG